MMWVNPRAGPGFVEWSVNVLFAPSNGSDHCAVFDSFAYSIVETQFSGSWKLITPGVGWREAEGA
jgi:hypothetical protein